MHAGGRRGNGRHSASGICSIVALQPSDALSSGVSGLGRLEDAVNTLRETDGTWDNCEGFNQNCVKLDRRWRA
eukprot:4310418-Prymnesium_polylepis.1